ncbi:hypothetical protein [Oceanobacillus halophilus]|uniref:Uncharacterized protein n=1 Tax=Oceanobacillus halophilus TaxID=930130 RepID=A0A495ABG5_9BACI|nr:hypothetical protein [Oceanobacillus halophilus]RKQ37359.1 hypothetical protein D8M06_00725 [Oceanobacillus halophilus]
MRKSNKLLGLSILGTLVLIFISYLVKEEEKYSFHSSLELAGKPDQVSESNFSHVENAKMVSEGSQFGVQYYNNLNQ